MTHAPAAPASGRETSVTDSEDPWRIAEWNALPDRCAIAGCDNDDADQRGPVQLRDGTMFKACSEHWEAIFRILGELVMWERMDGGRQP